MIKPHFLSTALGLFFTVIILNCMAQSEIRCTFLMTSAELDEGQKVYITGNLEELGYWDPAGAPMEYAGQHTWVREISVPGPASVEYKYTLGSWEREGADGSGQPLANFTLNTVSDTLISDTITAWTDRPPPQKPPRSILGRADHYPQMKGNGLRDRDVVVWLPAGYEEDPGERYPVIYLHDGQNAFDAGTSAYGTEWRVDESIDSLAKAGEIRPFIAVAVYNTPDRSAEYLPGDTAKAYMNFMVHQLKPFIDSAYRTRTGPEHTFTCGASAGGTIAFMLVWEHPETFSTALCMSPALKILEYDYVTVVESTKEKKKGIFLYMDVGGIGIDSALKPGILEMTGLLEQKGYHAGKDFLFVEDPAAAHNEAAWAERFPSALLECIRHRDK